MTTPAAPGRAVFLDRDGTILDELGYLGDPAALRLLPGAAQAVAELNRLGLAVVVVTNQSGIARGLFDEAALARVHARLAEELRAAAGATVDAWYHCPHHPEHGTGALRADCACRKPRPGMFLDACRELALDPARSFAVGDAARDLAAARAAGVAHRLLVRTGKGAATEETLDDAEAVVVDDLPAAASWIAARLG